MNKVILIGNLTKDLETRETPSGKTVANFSIAVNRPFNNDTDFFNITVWDKQAENCAKFLKKGSKVGIVGYLYNRSYEANDGTKRTVTEINCSEIEFIGKPQNSETETVQNKRPALVEIQDNQLPF